MSSVGALKSRENSSAVDLSFVIPAFNEEAYIKSCLAAILQTMASSDLKYEVIVVDNGSTDGTGTIASGIEGVKVISIMRTSISEARNLGAHQACGNYLAFIDSDVVITREWVSTAHELVSVDQLDVTGCKYDVRPNPSYIEKYWFNHLSSKYINGGNLIVRRSAFFRIDGFSEKLKTGEDVDFCMRAIQGGLVFKINSGFRAIHLGYPATLRGFIRREIWHGEGDFKSLHTFLSSKIAILAVAYCCAQVAVLSCFLLGAFDVALFGLAGLVSMNAIITSIRFRRASWIVRLANMPLNFVYFSCRCVSLIRAVGFRHRSY